MLAVIKLGEAVNSLQLLKGGDGRGLLCSEVWVLSGSDPKRGIIRWSHIHRGLNVSVTLPCKVNCPYVFLNVPYH